MTILQVSDLSVAFPARDGTVRTVVDRASFSIAAGDVFAIVGESGSGKSMIARSIIGLLPAGGRVTSGSIRLGGDELLDLEPARLRDIRGQRISMIFQEPTVSLNPTIRIGRQLTEAAERHTTMTLADIEQRAVDLLERVQVAEPATAMQRYPHEFSGGMCQRIMIASALMLEPELLIADEPTTALDCLVQKDVLEILLDVSRQEGTSVLLISHDLSLVAGHSDSVAVIEQGRIVESGISGEILARPTHNYTRRLLESLPAAGQGRQSQPEPGMVCTVRDLVVDYPVRRNWFWEKPQFKRVLDQVNLDIGYGETVALVGESGSGKTTLGKAILQLVEASQGTITVDGTLVTGADRPGFQPMSDTVQLVFQNPYAALSPRINVLDTVAEPLLRGKDTKRERARARAMQMLEDVGLGAGFAGRLPHELSGGQRQRVSIARALILSPRLIIADEPVSALDVTIQAQILALLQRLRDKHGFSCLFISHDLGVVESIADRVVVLYRGEVVETGDTEALFGTPKHPYTRALLTASPELRKTGDHRYELHTREFAEA